MEDEEKENADSVFAAKSLTELLVLFDKGDHYRNLWDPVIVRLLKYKGEKRLNTKLDAYLEKDDHGHPDRKILRLLSTELQLAKFVNKTFRGDNKLDLQYLIDHEKITDTIKQEMYEQIRNAHQRYYLIRHVIGDTDFWAALASNENEKQIVAYSTIQLQKFDPNFSKVELVKRRILGMMESEMWNSRQELFEELLSQVKTDKEFIHSLINPRGGFHHNNRSKIYPMISDEAHLEKMLRREKSYQVRKTGFARLKELNQSKDHLELLIHIIKTDRTMEGLEYFIGQLGILSSFSPILVDKFLNPKTPQGAVTDLFDKFKYCSANDPIDFQRIMKSFCEVGEGTTHYLAAKELDDTPENAQYLLEMLQKAIETGRNVPREELIELLDDAGRLKILEDYGDNLFRYSDDKLKIILRRFTPEDLSNLTVLYTDSAFGKIARNVLREK